jgi:hypothetical protein
MVARSRLVLGAETFGTSKTFERKFKRVVDGLAVDAIRAMQPTMDRLLNSYPGPVRRPIAWASDRQRRAFFATKGFGKGIPTQRTGRVLAWRLAFKADTNKAGGAIILENPTPYAKYVFGGFNAQGAPQQPFHANTGYPRAIVAQPLIFAEGEAAIADGFAEALQAFGAFTTEVRNR